MARRAKRSSRKRTRAANADVVYSTGTRLLSSIVSSVSVKTLRAINPDTYFSAGDNSEIDKQERKVYNFIRSHFDDFRVLPTAEIVAENTGIGLPEVDQPPEYYLRRVRQRAMYRHIRAPFEMLSDAVSGSSSAISDVEDAIDELVQLRSKFLTAGTGIELSDSIIEDVLNDMQERKFSGGVMRGITTGYAPLDLKMDGYNNDDLVVWVGRPGRAKSWLLLYQCHAAWAAGYKPLYISMEMGARQNMRRLISIHSKVNPTFIKNGQLSTYGQRHVEMATQELLRLRPLHMVTANFSRTVDQIAEFIDEYRPDICYIDAGYLLSPRKKRYGSSGRRETISDVVEEIKELGSNAGIPIVTTVQFNRAAEQRRRGSNSRRREGEAVETDPIAHLSLAEIGETDVIGQTASHVLGIEYPPFPLPKNKYRVFGFLKGREGENGWWLSNFMEQQNSPVDLSIVPYDDPIYQVIRNTDTRPARNRPAGQRSAAMAIQD